MQIDGLTKKVSFEEAQKAVEENKSIVGIVAIRPLDLLELNKEEYWDLLEEEVFDGIILQKDGMNDKILEYNKEHEVLLVEVELELSDIEERDYNEISEKFKNFLINNRESNKNLEWLRKEILKIVEENTFSTSKWKGKNISEIKITPYMEDVEVVKDVVLVDNEKKEYNANKWLYRKLEELYRVFILDLYDERVCEKLEKGLKLGKLKQGDRVEVNGVVNYGDVDYEVSTGATVIEVYDNESLLTLDDVDGDDKVTLYVSNDIIDR